MARVLVIEDEPAIALILTEVLSAEGHIVESAADGAAGLTRLHERAAPDVVLLDLIMPGVGGRAVLAAMRSEPPLAGIPVILVTGAVPSSRDFPAPDQYQALLTKPFQLTDVVAAVERCLEPPPGDPSPL